MKLTIRKLPITYVHPQGYTIKGGGYGLFEGERLTVIDSSELNLQFIISGINNGQHDHR